MDVSLGEFLVVDNVEHKDLGWLALFIRVRSKKNSGLRGLLIQDKSLRVLSHSVTVPRLVPFVLVFSLSFPPSFPYNTVRPSQPSCSEGEREREKRCKEEEKTWEGKVGLFMSRGVGPD